VYSTHLTTITYTTSPDTFCTLLKLCNDFTALSLTANFNFTLPKCTYTTSLLLSILYTFCVSLCLHIDLQHNVRLGMPSTRCSTMCGLGLHTENPFHFSLDMCIALVPRARETTRFHTTLRNPVGSMHRVHTNIQGDTNWVHEPDPHKLGETGWVHKPGLYRYYIHIRMSTTLPTVTCP
jgi:hypothetical protein